MQFYHAPPVWMLSLYDCSPTLSFSNGQSSIERYEERCPRFTTVVPRLTYYIIGSRNIRDRLSLATYDDSVMIPLSWSVPMQISLQISPLCIYAVADCHGYRSGRYTVHTLLDWCSNAMTAYRHSVIRVTVTTHPS